MNWIYWSQQIQAIAQNGLTYAKDKFDIERYKKLQDLAAEIISTHTDHSIKEVQDYITKETGYATPKIDVRGVVLQGKKLLLVKEKIDNLWTLPGGWADIHETPSENIEREVREESGYVVKANRLLALYDRNKHGHEPAYPYYVYKIFFLCELVGGKPQAGIETSGVGFYNLNNLPELSVSRVTHKQIQRMMELIQNNQIDFD